ncbi:MAG: TetR/AcrR family transcriptional regulator [Gammaproteobacteria bacterium]|nr:TetR/AcrR family transcriptional regulator [Gammaproteobacteria bacterium]
MARRSDHSREEIRHLALDAAEEIIASDGYKGLSARKIAKAIGYTVGTLYLVFKNLDDLIIQVNGRTLDNLYDWLTERHGDSMDGHQSLLSLTRAYIDYAEQESPRWNLLTDYVVENGQELPDWYEAKLGKVFGLVEHSLAECNSHHDDLTMRRAARVLWAGVNGICISKIRHRFSLAGGQSATEMAEMLIDTFLRGFSQQ